MDTRIKPAHDEVNEGNLYSKLVCVFFFLFEADFVSLRTGSRPAAFGLASGPKWPSVWLRCLSQCDFSFKNRLKSFLQCRIHLIHRHLNPQVMKRRDAVLAYAAWHDAREVA